ncbi:hypothetical protein LCGC14_0808120 [marine sediment metagenome]|uniref:Uncharacterized protein n=1 Tax=marine sediment metagenome TaxID=412755 RepID=A0A0F9S7M8_9ZZZZ
MGRHLARWVDSRNGLTPFRLFLLILDRPYRKVYDTNKRYFDMNKLNRAIGYIIDKDHERLTNKFREIISVHRNKNEYNLAIYLEWDWYVRGN